MSIKSSHELVQEALKEIKTINIDQAFELSQNNKCNVIDIRDIRELDKEGRVDNSHHIPRGMLEFWLDPSSEYFQEKKIGDKKNIVLFCALGFRSALATKALKDMGFENVANASGGFAALKDSGVEVILKEKN